MKPWRRWRLWRKWFHHVERQVEQIELAEMVLDHLDAQAEHVDRLADELIERQSANHFRQMFEEALGRKGRGHA